MVHDGTGHIAAVGHTRGKVRQTRKAFEVRSVHVSTPSKNRSKNRRTWKLTRPCARNIAIEIIP